MNTEPLGTNLEGRELRQRDPFAAAVSVAAVVGALTMIALLFPAARDGLLLWAQRWRDVVEAGVAGATVLLAVFTAAMAISTNRLAKETAQSLVAANNAYSQTERHHQQALAPIIVCEQPEFNPTRIGIQQTGDEPPTQVVQITRGILRNIGGGPAINIAMDVSYNDSSLGTFQTNALIVHAMRSGDKFDLVRDMPFMGDIEFRVKLASDDEQSMLDQLDAPGLMAEWTLSILYSSPFSVNRYATVYQQRIGEGVIAKLVAGIVGEDPVLKRQFLG